MCSINWTRGRGESYPLKKCRKECHMESESYRNEPSRPGAAASASPGGSRLNITNLAARTLIFTLLLVFASIVPAQTNSGVTGVVTDPSGALIPGVQVTLTDTKTSRELTTTTNDQGTYFFNNVQPGGGYRL